MKLPEFAIRPPKVARQHLDGAPRGGRFAGSLVRALLPALLLVAACSGKKLEPIETSGQALQTLTPDELRVQLNSAPMRIGGIKADLELGFQAAPGEDVRRCRAKLLSEGGLAGEGSAGIYLKGYRRLIPTFFTLVSDGREFWLHLPRDDKVITGPVDLAEGGSGLGDLKLQARDLVRALYFQPVDSLLDLELGEEGEVYILTLRDGPRPRRRLWIERRQLTVERETYYNAQGAVELEIQRSAFARLGEQLFPTEITLLDPSAGGAILLGFTKVRLDPESIPSEAFHFKVPDGVEIQRLEGVDNNP